MNELKQSTAAREPFAGALAGRLHATADIWLSANSLGAARITRGHRGQLHDTKGPEPGLPAPRSARLVIVEDGANVHELEPPPDGCEHTVVVVQSRGERPSAFAQRVRRRLRGMREEQHGVVWALFLLAARYDAEAQAARVEIARLLNRNAQTLPTRSCVLALHAPAAAQWWVLKLFDALVLEHGCPGLSAHIRFDQPRRGENDPSRSVASFAQRGLSHVDAKQSGRGIVATTP